MSFVYFKNYIKQFDEDEYVFNEQIAKIMNDDLKNNQVFNTHTYKLYEAGGSGGSSGSGSSGGSGNNDQIPPEIKKKLDNIGLDFNNCAMYLGETRMLKIISSINSKKTKLKNTWDKEKTFTDKTSQAYQDFVQNEKDPLLANLYRAVINNARNIQIPSGREDIYIKYKSKGYTITDKNGKVITEGLKTDVGLGAGVGLATGGLAGAGIGALLGLLFNLGKKVVAKLWNKWKTKENDGKECKGTNLSNLYPAKEKDIDSKATDEEKKQAHVTWAKKVDNTSIDEMTKKNTEHDFFKNLILVSYTKGPTGIDDLMNACYASKK